MKTAIASPPPQASSEPDQRFERRVDLVMEAVDLYHEHLHSYVRSRGNAGEPDDILQDLWQYVLIHFKEEDILNLKLLRRKSLQLYIDQYRKRKRRTATFESLDAKTIDGEHPAMGRRVRDTEAFSPAEEAQLKNRFWQEFPELTLTNEQRAVVWAYGRYGMTYQEIEEQLGVPTSTIGDWIKLARQQLNAALND